ncbi:sensor histidine kinase [Nesterenkonia flava]|uniref:Histidine kinase n=1 Tax=Nesterenkonia flava TaxID=469799 RepID=A0ABU1FUL5_9MICC|nr:histidine kinase [Nesterenkonia flava]MDR5712362.1 histidine kinase [Nesterenkonia flava]
MTANTESTHRQIRRLNIVSLVASTIPIGIIFLIMDAQSWVDVVILGAGVLGAVIAVLTWRETGTHPLVYPALAVTALSWVLSVVVVDSPRGFFMLAVVAGVVISKLPRHRLVSGFVLGVAVAAIGALDLMLRPERAGDQLVPYIVLPGGMTWLFAWAMVITQRHFDLVGELGRLQQADADLAVMRERFRFASDLHDIQGHALHVVKLKVTLAEKLLRRDPERAAQELREVHELVADTITRTKELAYAQHTLNLNAELENVKNLFEAAGIRVSVEKDDDDGVAWSELLGQVLRETTTNILRHAQATHVRIIVTGRSLRIENDGAAAASTRQRGLATLRERLAQHDGRLETAVQNGRFTTYAVLPEHGCQTEVAVAADSGAAR